MKRNPHNFIKNGATVEPSDCKIIHNIMILVDEYMLPELADIMELK